MRQQDIKSCDIFLDNKEVKCAMNIRPTMARTGSLPSIYSMLSIKSAAISQNSLICLPVSQTAGRLHDFAISLLLCFPSCLTVDTVHFLSWCGSVCDHGLCDRGPPFLALSEECMRGRGSRLSLKSRLVGHLLTLSSS